MVSKDDLVEQFVAVTGSDKDTASHMLEACSNNLDNAVTTFFDGDLQGTTSTNGMTNTDGNVRAPIPQTQGVLVEDFQPTRWRPIRGRSVFNSFHSIASLEENGEDSSGKKIQKLEQLFRPPVDIMHKGSFQSARNEAISVNKWLMVNIQNVTEFSCQILNRDVWSDKKIKQAVKKHFLFWQESSESQQGEWYMTFYSIDKWPHVSILDPRTGGRLLTITDITKDNFLDNINLFLADHGTRLEGDTSNSTSKEDILHLNEDQQLAAAIAASLKESRTSSSILNDSSSDCEHLSDYEEACAPHSQSNRVNENEKSSSTTDSSDSRSPIKQKNFKKVFLPRKRKITQASDPFSSLHSKQSKSSDDESCEYFLPPEYPVSTNTNQNSASSSNMLLLLRHPDGTREELSLTAFSNIKDLKSAVASKYDLRTHELVKNFPHKNISSMPAMMSLKDAGVFHKDTIFIREKL